MENPETIVFWGQYLVRSNTGVVNRLLQQEENFE
jgi:hypothetical protein